MLPMQSEKIAHAKVYDVEAKESSDEDSEHDCMTFPHRAFKKEVDLKDLHSSSEMLKKNRAKRAELRKIECECKVKYGWTEESNLKWMKIEEMLKLKGKKPSQHRHQIAKPTIKPRKFLTTKKHVVLEISVKSQNEGKLIWY